MRTLTRNRPLLLALLLALALRGALALLAFAATGNARAFREPDSASYLQAAREMLTTGRFTINGLPELERTPGYPALLLPGVALGSAEIVTIVLQALLACLTAYLVYRLALLLSGRPALAAICALLYAVEPISILYTSKLLSETLFTAASTLFLYLFTAHLVRGKQGYLAGAALALAASIYVRPIMYYYVFVAVVALLVWLLVKRQAAVAVTSAMVFVVVAGAFVGAWQVRNAAETGYAGFSAIADVNFYFYQGASVLAEDRGVSLEQEQAQLGYNNPARYFSLHPEQRAWSRADVYEYQGAQGRRTVLSGLATYAVIHAKGMALALLSPGGTSYLEMFGLYREGESATASAVGLSSLALSGALLAVYLVFGLVGLLVRKTLQAPLWPALVLGAYLLVMAGGPQAESRFRHPIMPVLCLLAGYGLFAAWNRLRGRADASPHTEAEAETSPAVD